jgi:hypothetical protein
MVEQQPMLVLLQSGHVVQLTPSLVLHDLSGHVLLVSLLRYPSSFFLLLVLLVLLLISLELSSLYWDQHPS